MPLPSPETLGHLPTVIFLFSPRWPTLLLTHTTPLASPSPSSPSPSLISGGDFPLGQSPTFWVLIPGGSAQFPTPTSRGGMEGGSSGKGGTGQITGRIALLGRCGAERLAPRRGTRPPQPCPHSAPPLIPFSAVPAREGTLGAGAKEAPGWAGRGSEGWAAARGAGTKRGTGV